MNFMVIRGGLDKPAEKTSDGGPSPVDVLTEARRRLAAIGYEASYARYLATGIPVPAPVRYLHLQISYAAEAMARLDPIPIDYRADPYWPG